MAFSDKFADILGRVAEAVDDNKYLNCIKNAFTFYMPFVIIGSFAALFKTAAGFESFSFLKNLQPAFAAINFATMSSMSLVIVFLLGMLLAKKNKQPEYLAGMVAIMSYIAIVPQSVTAVVEGAQSLVNNVLPASSMNAQGLFVGMFVAILSVELFTVLMKFDKLQIKMPPSVPAAISKSFNTLIPLTIVLFVFGIVGSLFVNFTGSYISEYMYVVLQKPLETVVQTPFGIVALVLVSQLLWIVGIHGGLVISPLRNPLLISALANNIEQVQAGGVATNPITMTFWGSFIVPGGAGVTIALIIGSYLFSKRDDYKMISQLSFLPGLCGINEPITFGLPIVLNPIMAIPFVLTSVMGTLIGLFATSIGFIPCSVVDVPFGIPIIANAFMGYGTFNAVIVQLVIIALSILLYVPFIKIANRQYLKEIEEQEVVAEQ